MHCIVDTSVKKVNIQGVEGYNYVLPGVTYYWYCVCYLPHSKSEQLLTCIIIITIIIHCSMISQVIQTCLCFCLLNHIQIQCHVLNLHIMLSFYAISCLYCRQNDTKSTSIHTMCNYVELITMKYITCCYKAKLYSAIVRKLQLLHKCSV